MRLRAGQRVRILARTSTDWYASPVLSRVYR